MTEVRRAGHTVWILGQSADHWPSSNIKSILTDLDINYRAPVPPDGPGLEAFLAKEQFDVIVHVMWYWDGPTRSVPNLYVPAIKKMKSLETKQPLHVILTDDVHWERESMLADIEFTPRRKSVRQHRATVLRESERTAYESADVVVTISEEDSQRVRNLMRNSTSKHVFVVHYALKEPDPSVGLFPPIAPFGNRSGILFSGYGPNPTNQLSMGWFLQKTWPMVYARLPGVSLDIVGTPPGPANWAGRSKKTPMPAGVRERGWVKDLDGLLDQARLFVAPIYAGTGVLTKNLKAWTRGVPTVTTRIGVQGYRLYPDGTDQEGRQISLVANDATELGNQLVRLYLDEGLWGRVSQACLRHSKLFGHGSLVAEVTQLVDLIQDLLREEASRQQQAGWNAQRGGTYVGKGV